MEDKEHIGGYPIDIKTGQKGFANLVESRLTQDPVSVLGAVTNQITLEQWVLYLDTIVGRTIPGSFLESQFWVSETSTIGLFLRAWEIYIKAKYDTDIFTKIDKINQVIKGTRGNIDKNYW